MLAEANGEVVSASHLHAKALVWDWVVRSFHWVVATGCFVDLFILDDGKAWHRAIGYAIALALVVRVTWGFVGAGHARFSAFVPSPSGLLCYLRSFACGSEPRFLGHNPAGAIMILLLMALLASVLVTGSMLTLDAYFGDERLEALHGALADVLIALVVLHVLAALYESFRHKENLVWSMITGYKRP
ncbi:MAG: cytochrome b/b6 domain-containing protein [Methylocystis silviterrae]|uniref:cytochrome b/b6 domain-containing protein n=1 Tax=Methylocystis silviterrae TaxID=2743612 RepID=UPI003C70CC04